MAKIGGTSGARSRYLNDKRDQKHKADRIERNEMKKIKTKFRTVKKYTDADPMTVSGTILRLMRKNTTDPKWKQVKGKDVRSAHRKRIYERNKSQSVKKGS